MPAHRVVIIFHEDFIRGYQIKKYHYFSYAVNEALNLSPKKEQMMATVVYDLGFEYPQYFARLFKKKTSMTPTEYRKTYH